MLHNKNSLSDIKHKFAVGNTIYYGCIFPEYDWFSHEFKLKKLIKPESFKITISKIMPSQINNEDRFLLARITFTQTVRKYNLYLTLENDTNEDKTIFDIYENKDGNFLIIFENHTVISSDLDVALESFYKLVIDIKSDINFESEETKIVYDDNFKLFRDIYNHAKELYPEEVIKSHDKEKKIV